MVNKACAGVCGRWQCTGYMPIMNWIPIAADVPGFARVDAGRESTMMPPPRMTTRRGAPTAAAAADAI